MTPEQIRSRLHARYAEIGRRSGLE
jgi:hypothetical protein